MYELIANPPWYVPTILAAVAVIFLMQGNNRQNKRLKYAGLGCAIAAATVYGVSHFLESPYEKVTRKTEELAAAVDGRDWEKFAALLDPKVKFYVYNGKETLRAGAEKSADAVGVKNISLSNLTIKDEPGAYIVDFTAAADIGEMGRRMPTNWRFHWGANDYLLYRIDFVPSEQVREDAVFSRMVRP